MVPDIGAFIAPLLFYCAQRSFVALVNVFAVLRSHCSLSSIAIVDPEVPFPPRPLIMGETPLDNATPIAEDLVNGSSAKLNVFLSSGMFGRRWR